MATIPQSYYIPVEHPYPAMLFAFNHPLRVNSKPDLARLFKLQSTKCSRARVVLKYHKSNEGE